MLKYGQEVLDTEISALKNLRDLLDAHFVAALDLLGAVKGRVVVSGMGKAGIIARKISATLASTGTPSFTLHPAEALHGDLGMLHADDLCLLLSNSGESVEMTQMLPAVREIGAQIIAITGNLRSTLAAQADLTLWIGNIAEACPLGLAPTASTTAMLALGDALALGLMRRKNFQEKDFALFHPGGALGKKSSPIRNFMRRGERLAMIPLSATIADTLLAITKAQSGAAAVVNPDGTLAGIFCDGDLRRCLQHDGKIRHEPVAKFMTTNCTSAPAHTPAGEILNLMRQKHIAEIPLLDENQRVIGMADLKLLIENI